MPRVHLFAPMSDIRAQARSIGAAGLHAGIDIAASDPLFGDGWGKEARELGAFVNRSGLKSIMRGPGRDLSLGALDPYVIDQVRACHERALAVAALLRCSHYIVKMPAQYGFARSQRLATMEAAGKMLVHLSSAAAIQGVRLLVQHEHEPDLHCLETVLDRVKSVGAGLVFSPARAWWSRFGDPSELLDRFSDHVVGLDLTDLTKDLEPTCPMEGLLGECPWIPGLLARNSLELCTIDVQSVTPDKVVECLNGLAHQHVAMA